MVPGPEKHDESMGYASGAPWHLVSRIGAHFVLCGQVLVIQLTVFVVHSESGRESPSGPSSPATRRDRNARIDIAVVLLAEARAHAAEPLRPAGGKIERIGLAVHLVEQIEDGVAHAQVKGQIGPPLEFVLRRSRSTHHLRRPFIGRALLRAAFLILSAARFSTEVNLTFP